MGLWKIRICNQEKKSITSSEILKTKNCVESQGNEDSIFKTMFMVCCYPLTGSGIIIKLCSASFGWTQDFGKYLVDFVWSHEQCISGENGLLTWRKKRVRYLVNIFIKKLIHKLLCLTFQLLKYIPTKAMNIKAAIL